MSTPHQRRVMSQLVKQSLSVSSSLQFLSAHSALTSPIHPLLLSAHSFIAVAADSNNYFSPPCRFSLFIVRCVLSVIVGLLALHSVDSRCGTALFCAGATTATFSTQTPAYTHQPGQVPFQTREEPKTQRRQTMLKAETRLQTDKSKSS